MTIERPRKSTNVNNVVFVCLFVGVFCFLFFFTKLVFLITLACNLAGMNSLFQTSQPFGTAEQRRSQQEILFTKFCHCRMDNSASF